MIDLHCHILPGLDDGAENLEDSLRMAALAADQGIRRIVATPHCITGSAWEITQNVAMLRQLLEETHIPLQVYPGMEIFGTFDTARLLRQQKLLTLNGSRYPLIEFDFGTDGEEEISAETIATAANSFNYEQVCSVSGRVSRVYCE